mgnify:CR=1 FL=1
MRRALLEADVQVAVARDFIARVEARAVGDDVLKSLTPGQQVVGLVRDELESLLGKTPVTLAGSPHVPTVVLLAGLQGSGKTTFAGKLARWLKAQVEARAARERRRLPSGRDRPAREAGRACGRRVLAGAGRHAAGRDRARAGWSRRATQGSTSCWSTRRGGCTSTTTLMSELEQVKSAIRPHQVLLVVDGMTGQEAVRIGETFTSRIGVDGLVLTKMDGDARGGAALSLRQATGKPILFLGVGEKLDGLEPFNPGRLAGRILGMGDVLGLVERRARHDRRRAGVAPRPTSCAGRSSRSRISSISSAS